MWCGFQNHFYLLQDMEQRYPAPPLHTEAWFSTAVSGAKSDSAHPERPFPLVSDAIPKLCWLSWLHLQWLQQGLDAASDAGTARAESHPAPPLVPAGTRSDCDDPFHCRHSTWTATLHCHLPPCPESANIPASKSPLESAEIPRGSTMLPLWMSCSGVNH